VRNFIFYLMVAFAIRCVCLSQDPNQNMNMPDMSGMAPDEIKMQPNSLIELLLEHATSGTDAERACELWTANSDARMDSG
jgi:hypothetical protein